MKKVILTVLLLTINVLVSAQEKNNEIKVNVGVLIFEGIEVTYERILNNNSSIGISYASLLNTKHKNDYLDWYLSPYYRYFLGKKRASGFFFEGFGMLNSTNRNLSLDCGSSVDESITDFALGLGMGSKWVTKGGFVGELNIGLGRNLFDNRGDLKLVGKIGVTLGYRF